MCSGNSDKFCYDNCITCSHDQLCRQSILFFTRRCAVSDSDRYSGRNLFFYCRIDDRCGYRSDHTELKHCGNLYGYLYNGCCGWMCCTNSNDFCYHHYITCSYDQLCRQSILFFTRRCAVSDSNRYSGRNLFFHCRINDRCGYRSDHAEHKHCGNLYSYLYNGSGGRMCCTDSNDFCYYNCVAGGNIQL